MIREISTYRCHNNKIIIELDLYLGLTTRNEPKNHDNK